MSLIANSQNAAMQAFRPHVVTVTDTHASQESQTLFGPYADQLDALQAADVIRARLEDALPGRMSVAVHPLVGDADVAALAGDSGSDGRDDETGL